ncbi:hypothetical protein [Acidovorax sp. BLS4]|uniref:hypothetical protein n=1 Tax=Acidovorax sp. BLS4 TaxID=3273430 RepID=UPI002942F735|nr:hypothetical protein [Paracidovorax avenae]WOI45884.1 hypothetical protein R1Z03_01315 [Paracidovorax avenae]
MTRAPTKNVQMACLKIGHYDYLMPAAKAIKVAELMQDAFDCDRDYGDSDFRYTVKATQPNVSFSLVRANQVRMPEGEPVPARIAKPRLLK